MKPVAPINFRVPANRKHIYKKAAKHLGVSIAETCRAALDILVERAIAHGCKFDEEDGNG